MQKGESGEETWKATIASVHADIGYAPASAMLSAYGFYDGTQRDDPSRDGTPKRLIPGPPAGSACPVQAPLQLPSSTPAMVSTRHCRSNLCNARHSPALQML